jgi:hypothetical protein
MKLTCCLLYMQQELALARSCLVSQPGTSCESGGGQGLRSEVIVATHGTFSQGQRKNYDATVTLTDQAATRTSRSDPKHAYQILAASLRSHKLRTTGRKRVQTTELWEAETYAHELTLHRVRNLIHNWRQHPTRATPRCPEVHKNWQGVFKNQRLEVCVGGLDGCTAKNKSEALLVGETRTRQNQTIAAANSQNQEGSFSRIEAW